MATIYSLPLRSWDVWTLLPEQDACPNCRPLLTWMAAAKWTSARSKRLHRVACKQIPRRPLTCLTTAGMTTMRPEERKARGVE